MHDESAGRLLGFDLAVLGQGATDPTGIEQGEQLHVIAQIRAGGITETVA